MEECSSLESSIILVKHISDISPQISHDEILLLKLILLYNLLKMLLTQGAALDYSHQTTPGIDRPGNGLFLGVATLCDSWVFE